MTSQNVETNYNSLRGSESNNKKSPRSTKQKRVVPVDFLPVAQLVVEKQATDGSFQN